MIVNEFYVYAYIRSVDSENGNAGTPYYIGKGKGNRMHDARHNVGPPTDVEHRVIIEDNMTEEESFNLEIKLIAEHGRIDLGTGILRNLTDGGDGASGRIVTAEQRKKSSIANRGQKRSPATVANIKAGLAKIDFSGENNHFYGKLHTQDTKEKMSIAKKGKSWDEIYGTDVAIKRKESVSRALTGRPVSEETLQKLRKPKGSQKIVTCPHCNKSGGVSNMNRWHFNNCKHYTVNDLP